jgi:hypothetical protein
MKKIIQILTSINRKGEGKARATSFGFFVLLTVAGCSSIPQAPFETFNESLISLNQGTERAIAGLLPLSEERFKRELKSQLAKKQKTHLLALRIRAGAGPFDIKLSPIFFKTQQFGFGVNQVTSVMVDYSGLLLELSSPELISKEKFDSLSKDLNAKAINALKTIDTSPSQKAGENIALFSTAAGEAAKAFLEAKRKKNLLIVLSNNQKAIDEYANRMKKAVEIIAEAYHNEYQANFKIISKKITDPNTRDSAIEEVITLNRDHVENVKTLKELHDAFGQIPLAHNSLIKVVQNSNESLDGIIAVLESGKRFKESYEQALAANKISSIQGKADVAAAQADAAEAEAEAAALQADIVKMQAETARIEAENSNPKDPEKTAKADKLEAKATALADIAETKKMQAETLRESSNAVQESAGDIKKRIADSL